MRRLRTMLVTGTLATLVCALPSVSSAEEPSDDEGRAKKTSSAEREASVDQKPKQLSIYVPPSRGAARHRSGGGTRAATSLPLVSVLAPEHVGLTTEARPVLAWFASGRAEGDVRIEVTVVDDEAVDPLLEVMLDGPVEAGIHTLDAESADFTLEPGRTYHWNVALVPDPDKRDLDVVSGGAIRREAIPAEVDEEISAGTPDYESYARNGIWYDAIAALSARIEAEPERRDLRETRAAMLAQEGLDAAAAFDRAAPVVVGGTGSEGAP